MINEKIKFLSKTTLLFLIANFVLIILFPLFLFLYNSQEGGDNIVFLTFSIIFGIILLIIAIFLLVIGIFQIREISKDKEKDDYKLVLWAGIMNIVSFFGAVFLFIPIFGLFISLGIFISQIVLNFIILANLKQNKNNSVI